MQEGTLDVLISDAESRLGASWGCLGKPTITKPQVLAQNGPFEDAERRQSVRFSRESSHAHPVALGVEGRGVGRERSAIQRSGRSVGAEVHERGSLSLRDHCRAERERTEKWHVSRRVAWRTANGRVKGVEKGVDHRCAGRHRRRHWVGRHWSPRRETWSRPVAPHCCVHRGSVIPTVPTPSTTTTVPPPPPTPGPQASLQESALPSFQLQPSLDFFDDRLLDPFDFLIEASGEVVVRW